MTMISGKVQSFKRGFLCCKLASILMLVWIGFFATWALALPLEMDFPIEFGGEAMRLLLTVPPLAVLGLMIAGLGLIKRSKPFEALSPILLGTICAYLISGASWAFLILLPYLELKVQLFDAILFLALYGWIIASVLYAAVLIGFALYVGSSEVVRSATFYLLGIMFLPIWLYMYPRFLLEATLFEPMAVVMELPSGDVLLILFIVFNFGLVMGLSWLAFHVSNKVTTLHRPQKLDTRTHFGPPVPDPVDPFDTIRKTATNARTLDTSDPQSLWPRNNEWDANEHDE